jgi:DNA-binding GntR family transcriptional regulator
MIFAACVRRDPKAAGEAMRRHLQHTMDVTARELAEHAPD